MPLPAERCGRACAATILGGGLTLLSGWWLLRTSTRWGATDAEVSASIPGDELLRDGRVTTYAITIDAPPEAVWPWVAQMGRGRGGFYTYTWIEKLLGADIRNLDFIDSRLQELHQGDRIWMTPERYLDRLPGQYWQVRRVGRGQVLVLDRRPPGTPLPATWALVLQPMPGGRTRLLDRHRGQRRSGALGRLSDAFWSVGTLLMERGMLRGIRARAQRVGEPPARRAAL